MSTNGDLDLIQKYRSTGDNTYVGELFERYSHLVYGVCLKYLKNREKSQDAVMQIFEKLFSALREHKIKNFKSWLHVLTKNHCLMELRKKDPLSNKEIDESLMESGEALHHQDEEQLESDIRKLEVGIDNLSREQQVCIKLFYLENNSYAEIAQKTGYENKEVKSYIQNGKRNLKSFIEKNRATE